jgi:hypothetical protein
MKISDLLHTSSDKAESATSQLQRSCVRFRFDLYPGAQAPSNGGRTLPAAPPIRKTHQDRIFISSGVTAL